MINISVNPRTGEASLPLVRPGGRPIWEIRTEEQPYAFLSDQDLPERNRYGQHIDLIAHAQGKLPVGRSMFINENPAVGSNPNRNKQHGLFQCRQLHWLPCLRSGL